MFFLIFLFVFGTAFGSFLNVLIDRLPREESIVKDRSYCESCKHKLAWYDLIPLLSFIQLRGKCRYCQSSLSFYYPIVELVTGVLFVLTALFVINNFQFSIFNFQSNLNFQISISHLLASRSLGEVGSSLIFYFFIISSLIVIFFTDIKYGIIPDKVIFPTIIIALLFLVFTSKESWLPLSLQPATFEVGNRLLSGVGACAFFFFLFVITRGRGMGFGDVKYAFLMGLLLGFPGIIVGLYAAFLTGAVVSLILIVWGKKKLKGSTIPFGPFLVFGTFVALFFGEYLLSQFSIFSPR